MANFIGTGLDQVPLNQYLGSLAYQNANSVVSIGLGAGTAALPSLYSATNTSSGFWFPAANTIAASVNGAEQLRLTTTGLGIGTSSPTANLDIVGTSGTEQFRIGNTTGGTDFGITVTENNTAVINSAEGATGRGIQFQSGGTNTMLIDSAGNVGIGTSSPLGKLDVRGTAYFNGTGATGGASQLIAAFAASGGSNFGQLINTNTTWSLGYGASYSSVGTSVLTWDASGNVGIGTSSPAAKLDIYQSSVRYVRAYPSSGLADLEVVTNNNVQPVFAVKGTGTADLIRAYAGATQAMTLDASGNFQLGTTGSAGRMHIVVPFSGSTTTSLGDVSKSHIHLGDPGYNNQYCQITFGYDITNAAAAIGFTSTSATGNTKGDIVFATRDVTTSTLPTERARIDSAGTFILKNDYQEQTYTANSSTAITLNITTNGTDQVITLTGTATITMPTAVAGKSFLLKLKTGAGGYTVTWSTVKWPGGTAPTLTSAASKMDIFSFFSDGTNWYGTTVGQNYTP